MAMIKMLSRGVKRSPKIMTIEPLIYRKQKGSCFNNEMSSLVKAFPNPMVTQCVIKVNSIWDSLSQGHYHCQKAELNET